ncbi:hypothetical protein I2W78_00815 [Streptomyces spinoverrucosus]|uniref:hypothetical protein n=1 Tax=Streptomyces spinoverrucosus TaxID=284043 RepID=UPI0018C4498B|nr:hypothetical protein [Streptomyces spinoverrucosus]MBG0850437.1 hypothetical protein [Streptomyces spinoverrucosus]
MTTGEESSESGFERFARLVSQLDNEIFTVLRVSRADSETVHTTLRFRRPPVGVAALLHWPEQPVTIVTALSNADGPAYEDPAMEVLEFVLTDGINHNTVTGTGEGGALIVDARDWF